LDIPFICWFRVLFYIFLSLHAKEIGVGDKGSQDAATVDVQMLLEAFTEHVPEICLFH
jgi:hypothetical protein